MNGPPKGGNGATDEARGHPQGGHPQSGQMGIVMTQQPGLSSGPPALRGPAAKAWETGRHFAVALARGEGSPPHPALLSRLERAAFAAALLLAGQRLGAPAMEHLADLYREHADHPATLEIKPAEFGPSRIALAGADRSFVGSHAAMCAEVA